MLNNLQMVICMKIALVDDMKDIRELLNDILKNYSNNTNLEFEIDSFENSEEFLSAFNAFNYSIIFLDIYMTGISGIDAALKLRQKDTKAVIIFLTSSTEHMREAFACHAFDYLEKPLDTAKICKCLDEALQVLPKQEPFLSFSFNNIVHNIFYRNIACLYAEGHYTRIINKDGKQFRPYKQFSALSSQIISDKRFLTVSRGIICNMDLITNFSSKDCTLSCGMSIPITKRNARQLAQTWRDYEFSNMID